jgi:hypothetical protein
MTLAALTAFLAVLVTALIVFNIEPFVKKSCGPARHDCSLVG